MNIQSKSPRSINWKQIAFIAVVLGIAGFQYLNSRKAAPKDDGGREKGGTAQLDLPDEIDLGSALPKSGQSNKSSSKPDLKHQPLKGSNSGSKKSSSGPYLRKQGRKQVSPAGLVYAKSRIEHVMRHSHDIPDRQDSDRHGVFDADSEDDVFRLIDEAYKKIKSNSRDVSKRPGDPRAEYVKDAYTVDMKRRIGYLGGKRGKRSGNPPLTKIKLVVGRGTRSSPLSRNSRG